MIARPVSERYILSPPTTHYDKVDEVSSDGDKTYVYTNASGDAGRDLYELPNHTGSGVIIYVNVRAQLKRAASSESYAYICTKTCGQVYESAALEPGANWSGYSEMYTRNPNTHVAWTWSQVDALQAGIKLTYNTAAIYCTQVYMEVDYTQPTWASYKDNQHTEPCDHFHDSYDHAYMTGTGFGEAKAYVVAYYDAAGSRHGSDHNSSSDWDGILNSECDLTGGPENAYSDTDSWHSVVFPSTISPPSSYSAAHAHADKVIEDDFIVDSSVPEFPTVMAGIGVAGMCGGIYWWMRRKQLAVSS